MTRCNTKQTKFPAWGTPEHEAGLEKQLGPRPTRPTLDQLPGFTEETDAMRRRTWAFEDALRGARRSN